jgi:hypothetical protein
MAGLGCQLGRLGQLGQLGQLTPGRDGAGAPELGRLGQLGQLGQGFLLEDCYEGAGWVPRFVVRLAGIGQAGRTYL